MIMMTRLIKWMLDGDDILLQSTHGNIKLKAMHDQPLINAKVQTIYT